MSIFYIIGSLIVLIIVVAYCCETMISIAITSAIALFTSAILFYSAIEETTGSNMLGGGEFGCKFKLLSEHKPSERVISMVLYAAANKFDHRKYLRGVRNWAADKFPSYFSDMRKLIFVDPVVANDERVMKRLRDINNSEFIEFECPGNFAGGYHKERFGNMIRFIPCFQSYSKTSIQGEFTEANIVLVTDIEPNPEVMIIMERSIQKLDVPVDLYYYGATDFTILLNDSFVYPGYAYMYPNRFIVFKRLPMKVWTNFAEREDKSIEWTQGPISGFSRGSDELFSNKYMLKYCIDNDYTIAFTQRYQPNLIIRYYRDHIMNHPKSKEYLSYILDDEDSDVAGLVKKFRFMFGRNIDQSRADDQSRAGDKLNYTDAERKRYGKRYYEVLKNDDWLPDLVANYVLENYENVLYSEKITIKKGTTVLKIIDVVDPITCG